MRKLALVLLASTAVTSIAYAQTATTPTDLGTVNANPNQTATTPAPVKKVILPKKKIVKPVAPVATAAPSPAPANIATAPSAAPGISLSSDAAIGNGAPVGSAPALAPSQASLNATEPGSVVSDKVLRDIAQPTSDYNEGLKYTPGFVSSNTNGFLGDTKSSFRGLADGQFNIDYDGVPFGDENDPTHHSAAYFPGTFIGQTVIDRGPGEAHTIGYAPFGGDIALHSRELTDKASTEIEGSIGSFGTSKASATQQSGLVHGDTRALIQYNYAKTDGALQNANVDQQSVLAKLEHKVNDDWTVTLFGTLTKQNYNNTQNPTYAQLQKFGKTYGGLNLDPSTQQYIGWNNSQKQTDLEYIDLRGRAFGWQIDNKAYTYSYFYPNLQNNGTDQTIIGPASLANKGTVQTLKVPNPIAVCGSSACSTSFTFAGVKDGDVTGYKKYNDYRAWGDTLTAKKDIQAGAASGQLRTGVWLEFGDNGRYQQYYDYTKGQYYSNLGPVTMTGGTTPAQNAIDLAASSYKLQLDSKITNVQPWIEYEWKPTAALSITPGLKYESFSRHHTATVNQTTLQPADFSKTYTTTLPYLDVRYKLNPDLTVYAQASKGFLAPTVSAFYTFDVNADSSLAPQETTNYQIGTVYKTRNLTASADVYQITASNFPVNLTPAGQDPILQPGGTARYQGIEGEATYAFGNGLAVYGSGSWNHANFIDGVNAGLAVPNTAEYTAAAGLIYDKGQWFGSALYKVTGDQYGSAGEVAASPTVNNNLNRIGAYSSTDLVAGYRWQMPKANGGQNYEFKVGVTNVFDNTNTVDIGSSPKGLTDATGGLTYSTQVGRAVYAGMKIGF